MNTLLTSKVSIRSIKKQQGVVLFITLIALVALLLSSVALVRSVDTAGMIAGNLAFQMSATNSADEALHLPGVGPLDLLIAREGGAAEAVWTVGAHALNNNASPYYATIDADNDGVEDIAGQIQFDFSGDDWATVASPVYGPDFAGNSTSYVIQRLCRGAAGTPASNATCVTNAGAPENNNKRGGIRIIETGDRNLVYRITMRVTGPRNSVSYVQSFVF